MTKIVPTLTMDGFVSYTPHMLSKLYEYFLTANYSQTVAYYGDISSLDYLVKKNSNNIDELKNDIHDTLNTLLSRYWGIVEVESDIVKLEEDKELYTINISIKVTDDTGAIYTLEEVASIDNSTLILKDASKIDYLMS